MDETTINSQPPSLPEAKRIFQNPQGVSGVPTPPWPQCSVTVGYPLEHPELATVAMSPGCPDAQTALALSIMVTAFLRAAQAKAAD